MELRRLTSEKPITTFECGDEDLNGFLLDDAIPSAEKRIANTFVLYEDSQAIAYFCLLTDKITKQEVTKADWRRFKRQFPHGKQFSSYPSIKIGRFAVSNSQAHKGLGTNLLNWIKLHLLEQITLPAYRFITVDAYIEAIPFYEKNGFKPLQSEDENRNTRLMYFDILSLVE